MKKKLADSYAKRHAISLGEAFKKALFEKIEDEYDIALASYYLNGSPTRQNYLETAIRWIASRDGKEIEDYMAEHQHDTNCNELWLYVQSVISWVKATFPVYRSREMKGLDWGVFFNKYGTKKYDPKKLELMIVELLDDEDVTKQSGIYEYLLNVDKRHLSVRAFTLKMARTAYERQKGICPKCKKHFDIVDMQADHINPWSKGGKSIATNCQMLCAGCNFSI